MTEQYELPASTQEKNGCLTALAVLIVLSALGFTLGLIYVLTRVA